MPKALRSTQGQTFYSRPDILLKALRSAQGQTSCSRPDNSKNSIKKINKKIISLVIDSAEYLLVFFITI
ncbi:hypothetical protein M5K25_008982 [Dendrobium thyrsiflorum]|uniref:Uncharacterized protein n=1 Tax=Dendrobium thyrsiflorum TaxID=117978 RepID=A0ABD0VHB4_DENTH